MKSEQAKTKVSERFCAADADVTLRSCDDVLFKVHRTNLEMHSEGFAAQGMASVEGEIVSLSETSPVLDLLFQYMYRQPQPDLRALQFEVVAGLAEAVEKYQVYSAMRICEYYMQDALPNHCLEVLNYAARHNYPDIMNKASCGTVNMTREHAQAALSPAAFFAWVRYKEHWLEVLRYACQCASPLCSPTDGGWGEEPCSDCWTRYYAEIIRTLSGQLISLKSLHTVFGSRLIGDHDDSQVTHGGKRNKRKPYTPSAYPACDGCIQKAKSWRLDIEKKVEGIPSFSSLL